MNYNWNSAIFFDLSPEGGVTYTQTLLTGLKWTILTALCAWAIGFSVGLVIGVLRTLPSKTANLVGTVYVELFRNVPLLVQMFLWYFVLPEVLPTATGDWLEQLPYAPFYTGVLCLGLFTASRVAEQVRAGIQALPRGQRMAGTPMGFTTAQTYRYVLLPNADRIILPPLTSEFLSNLKNTSVMLTIGVVELTAAARSMQEFSFQVFEAFTAATVLYIIINLAVVALATLLERFIAIPGQR
ncbi:amino acid ABC transporter permease [Methylobacterium pseudosasicola]|nr:amino acid ABC transporter permease [Methylobacterium pseudosasicola]